MSAHGRLKGGNTAGPSLQPVLEAGRLYRSTGALSPELLRPHVFRSWERSHLGRADPRRPRAETLGPLDIERLLGRQDEVVHAAKPYMEALSRASGGERHAAMLADSRAVVLDVLGDESTIRGPERVPGPGALLDEAACGANGIGTALAEDRYVELVGPEHFIEGFHPFTCQGIPLHDGTGAVAGVLSVSVMRPEVGLRLREIMLCAGHAIEMELLSARLEGELQRALTKGFAPEGLERLLEDILQAQTAVRIRLELAAEQLSRSYLTHAQDLLALASTVLARFRRHASLWRELALDEPAPPRWLSLDGMLRELLEMLEVEATVREVELVPYEIEPIELEADPHILSRALFRFLLGAIGAARGGGLHIRLLRAPGSAELHATVIPGMGTIGKPPDPLRRLVVPLAIQPSAARAAPPREISKVVSKGKT